MTFASELRRRRSAAHLAQSGLAKATGLSQRSIQNWEQGHRVPRTEAILSLSKALEGPLEEIVAALSGQTVGPEMVGSCGELAPPLTLPLVGPEWELLTGIGRST